MALPAKIERTIELAHPPTRVWGALTTPEGLGAWLGDDATIDLRPDGIGHLMWNSGERTDLRVERVEKPRLFGFSWRLIELARPHWTYVEFVLDPVGDGTRLTVTESGFAALPDDDHPTAFDAHTAGWSLKLGELNEYLDVG